MFSTNNIINPHKMRKDPKNKQESYKVNGIVKDDRFTQRIVKSYANTHFSNKTIKKGWSVVTTANYGDLAVSVGTSFVKPVYSILTAAINTFFPNESSEDYSAGDITKNVAYRYYNKYVELEDVTNRYSNDDFTVVKTNRKVTNVNSTYHLVNDETGDLTTCKTHYGDVEVEYSYKYTDSDKELAKFALDNWSEYPYVYDYRIHSRPRDTSIEKLDYEEEITKYYD